MQGVLLPPCAVQVPSADSHPPNMQSRAGAGTSPHHPKASRARSGSLSPADSPSPSRHGNENASQSVSLSADASLRTLRRQRAPPSSKPSLSLEARALHVERYTRFLHALNYSAGPTPAEARTQSALAARDAHWIARAEDNRKGATTEESVVELEATAAAASMARCGRPRCGRALEADDDAGSSCIPLGLDSFRLFARLSCPELRLEPQIMQALLEIYLSYDRRPSAKELLWRLHDCGRMQAAGKTLPLFDEVSTAAIEA